MDDIKRVLGLEPGCADWGVLVSVEALVERCEWLAACRVQVERDVCVLREETGELLRERMVGDGFAEDVVAAAVRGYVQGPVEVLQAVYGVGDIVSGANPYGCNQYGEGWAEEHNGNSTKYEVTGFSGKQSKMLINKQGGNTVEVATKEKKPGKGAYPDASERGLGKAADDAERESEKKLAEKDKGKGEVKKEEKDTEGQEKKRYFEPAKDKVQAKKNTASLVGGKMSQVSWGQRMTVEQINEYNEVMSEMFDVYPLKAKVKKLGSYLGSTTEGAHCVSTIGYGPNGINVSVNIEINHDHDMGGVHVLPFAKPFEKPVDGFTLHNVGMTENGMSIRALMAHEHGHAIHAYVKANALGMAALFSEEYSVCKEANDNWIEAFDKARENKDVLKISKYASTNYAEFFAECFAKRVLEEEMPDYIESALDKIIKLGTKKA